MQLTFESRKHAGFRKNAAAARVPLAVGRMEMGGARFTEPGGRTFGAGGAGSVGLGEGSGGRVMAYDRGSSRHPS